MTRNKFKVIGHLANDVISYIFTTYVHICDALMTIMIKKTDIECESACYDTVKLRRPKPSPNVSCGEDKTSCGKHLQSVARVVIMKNDLRCQ